MIPQMAALNILSALDMDIGSPGNILDSGNSFSNVFGRTIDAAKGSFGQKAQGTGHVAAPSGSGSRGHVERLKEILTSSGASLKKMHLPYQDIHYLKNFLTSSGFSKTDIEKLIHGLVTDKSGTSPGINMEDLFAGLSELSDKLDKKKKPSVADISCVPYIEVALRRLGVNASDIDRVVSEGTTQNHGFDLKKFSKAVADIIEKRSSGSFAGPSIQAGEDIKEIFSRLGMQEQKEKVNGPISLEKFADLLEQGVLKMNRISPVIQEDTVKANGLTVSHEEDGAKTDILKLMIQEDRVKPDGLNLGSGKGSTKPDGLNPRADQIQETMQRLTGKVVVDPEKTDALPKLKSEVNQKILDGLPRPDNPQQKQADIVEKMVSDSLSNAVSTDTKKISTGLETGLDTKKHQTTKPEDRDSFSHTLTESRTPAGSSKAAQQAASPPARNLPLYVVDQVSHQISRSLAQGKESLTLRLKPPDLGTVMIDLGLKGNVLMLDMTAENPAARELIVSHVYELKQSLIDQGIRLERVEVQTHQFGQSMENAHRESNESRQNTTARNSGLDESEMDREGDSTDPAVLRVGRDTLVDLVA